MYQKEKRPVRQECDVCGESVYVDELEFVNGRALCEACYGELFHAIDAIDDLPYGLEKIFFEIMKDVYAHELGLNDDRKRVFVCSGCGSDICEQDAYVDIMDEQFCLNCIVDSLHMAGEETKDKEKE